MDEEKEQVCPKCGSKNVSVEINQESSDTSVIMGNFAPPFYMLCHDCNHKWYLVNEDDAESKIDKSEKQTQRERGALVVFLGYILPLLILACIIIFFALNN